MDRRMIFALVVFVAAIAFLVVAMTIGFDSAGGLHTGAPPPAT